VKNAFNGQEVNIPDKDGEFLGITAYEEGFAILAKGGNGFELKRYAFKKGQWALE
jgi:hypothetical protein